jgi:glucose-1-phosphatase
MTRPQAVIFDLGKVLVDFDYSIAGRRIAARGAISARQVQQFIDHSPLLSRFETGQINREQFFGEVRAAAGFEGTIEEFSEFFADIFTPIGEMVALHEELRERRVPTYIFSNTNELAVAHIRRNFPFFSRFDGYILSYEHGAMKPDSRLYKVVEAKTGRGGDELFYTDDRPENIETAASLGWQAVLHQSPQRTRLALQTALSV